MSHFDAIVIGTGPAGANAAYDLARAGVRSLMIEQQKLPRHKTCGGGVTHKAAQAFSFDISPAVERTISTFVLTYKLGRTKLVHSTTPLVYMVRRSQFDHLLTTQAVNAGAQLFDETKVTNIELGETKINVTTSRGILTTDHIVGADGATGITARALGLMKDRVLLPAIEHEVEVEDDIAEYWQDKMSLDLGSLRASYGWLFPKEDHFNVGVGGFGHRSDFSHELKNYDLEHLNRRVPKHLRVRKTFGYILPLRKEHAPIQKGRAMLIGDAAGLVEALTGEGIYYAARSGQIAAQSIIDRSHEQYQTRVDAEIMPDLMSARRYAALYRWSPWMCYLLALYWSPAWRTMCQVLRGEYQFRNVNRRLGLLGMIEKFLPAYA